MGTGRTLLIVMAAVLLAWTTAATAMGHKAEERGKAHFVNPKFAGGTKSCNACHPGGRGLGDAGTKKSFYIMGAFQNSLEEAINVCIVEANGGTAIPEDSEEMQDMASYIRSLGTAGAPGYGK